MSTRKPTNYTSTQSPRKPAPPKVALRSHDTLADFKAYCATQSPNCKMADAAELAIKGLILGTVTLSRLRKGNQRRLDSAKK